MMFTMHLYLSSQGLVEIIKNNYISIISFYKDKLGVKKLNEFN